MSKSKHFLNFDRALLQVILFYMGFAIFLLPHYQHQINPDGISYISIAQKYMQGDLHHAINGYWGPLLSWLLLPLLFLGFKPLLATKLLSFIIGLLTLFYSHLLMKLLEINGALKNILLCLIAMNVIYFAICVITPDLLFVLFSLAYLHTILGSSYLRNNYKGVISGLLGSALYLSKSYGFFFFAFHFFIVHLIFFLRERGRYNRINVLNKFISGMVVFSLISISWIYLISNKYGQLKIGTAGTYSHSIIGPNSLGQPIYEMGLLDPPNPTAISVWEDPTYLKIQEWKVFDSIDSIKHQINVMLKNALKIILILNRFSFLTFALLLMAVVYFLEQGEKILFDKMFYIFMTLMIFPIGYTLLWVVERYFWLDCILIMILGAKLLNLIFQKYVLKRISRIILIMVFIVSFSAVPLKELSASIDDSESIFKLNQKISHLGISGRIASNRSWDVSLYLSFFNGWRYFGQRGRLGELELEKAFREKGIDYYFVWGPPDEEIPSFKKYEEITQGRIDGLRIYKLR